MLSPGSERHARVREALVVFGATVGASIVAMFVRGIHGWDQTAYSDRHLLRLVAYELLLAALFIPWLRRRGWRPLAVAGHPAPADIHRGAGLWVLSLGCYWLVWIMFSLLSPATAASLGAEVRFTGTPAGPLAIVLASIINPVVEEFLWLGYGIARLSDWTGVRAAAVSSIVLRTAVHAYQGPWAVLGILPVGIVFTWYYVRTRRLWPVVIAHVMLDAIGLAGRLAGVR